MKTKEEILKKYFFIPDEFHWDSILKAMDDYAKEQSVAFAEHLETYDADCDAVIYGTPYDVIYNNWLIDIDKKNNQ